MNNKKDLFKGLLIMLVTVLVFTGAMFGLNFYTAPLIEANNAGAALAPLKAVMPDAEGFEALYDSADPSTLKDVAAEVISIYKETSGKGYVFRVKNTAGKNIKDGGWWDTVETNGGFFGDTTFIYGTGDKQRMTGTKRSDPLGTFKFY